MIKVITFKAFKKKAENEIELSRERYISPNKRHQIIDELRLI